MRLRLRCKGVASMAPAATYSTACTLTIFGAMRTAYDICTELGIRLRSYDLGNYKNTMSEMLAYPQKKARALPEHQDHYRWSSLVLP
jgi:hypothetical protein